MRKIRWSKMVQNIHISHYSGKAWSIVNNLTDRSKHSHHHFLVPSNAIVAQLLKNEGADCDSTVVGHQQQHQSISLVILRQHSLQPTSKIQSQVTRLYISGADHSYRRCLRVTSSLPASSLPACAISEYSSLEKTSCSRDPKALKT